MTINDFEIGCIFYTGAGKWECTDKGTRTIVAVNYHDKLQNQETSPPYTIPEYVFDEYDMEGSFTTPMDID